MRQDAGQVGKEALVNGEKTFGLNSLGQTIEHAFIEVTRLVVHSRHDCVLSHGLTALHNSAGVFDLHTRRVHNAGDNKSRRCATGQMQARALFHTQVSCQTSLGEEISGQLDGASETSPHHSSTNATVQTTHTLRLEYLAQSIERVAVLMLRANRKERRVGLEASLDEEEGRTECGTDDT